MYVCYFIVSFGSDLFCGGVLALSARLGAITKSGAISLTIVSVCGEGSATFGHFRALHNKTFWF